MSGRQGSFHNRLSIKQRWKWVWYTHDYFEVRIIGYLWWIECNNDIILGFDNFCTMRKLSLAGVNLGTLFFSLFFFSDKRKKINEKRKKKKEKKTWSDSIRFWLPFSNSSLVQDRFQVQFAPSPLALTVFVFPCQTDIFSLHHGVGQHGNGGADSDHQPDARCLQSVGCSHGHRPPADRRRRRTIRGKVVRFGKLCRKVSQKKIFSISQ